MIASANHSDASDSFSGTLSAGWIYDFWYFSRLNICSAALAVSAATSQVLVGYIEWRSVLFVALSTYTLYAIDDLLDRRLDEERFPILAAAGAWRTAWLVATAAAALLGTAGLVLQHRSFQSGWLIAPASLSLIFCCATNVWPGLIQGRYWSVWRALFISMVWSAVCVLTPVLWIQRPFSFHVARAFFFVWQLMFVIVMLWERAERRDSVGPDRLQSRFDHPPPDAYGLQWLCICSMAVVGFGVAMRHFPAANLSVACGSLVNLVAVRSWNSQTPSGRVQNDLLVAANNACCLLTIGSYAQDFRPGWGAVFQLVALTVLAALVAAKTAYVYLARGMNPFPVLLSERRGIAWWLDCLFVIGGGTFGFRVLLNALESDFLLFFPLALVLFDSNAARISGAVLVGAALVLIAAAYVALGGSWRIGVDEATPGPLVMSGIYRSIRHPIYLGAALYLVGTFLMTGKVVFLLFATIGPVLLHLRANMEEEALVRIYGDDYVGYLNRTKRYGL